MTMTSALTILSRISAMSSLMTHLWVVVANAAAFAIGYVFIINEYFFNFVSRFGGSFGKLVAERVGIAAFAVAGRENKYFFSHFGVL